MNYITNEQIKALSIPATDMLKWTKEMIQYKNETILPAKTSMKLENHIFYNIMPCVLPQFNVAGVKIVNRYPNNSPCLKSNLLLYDLNNGDILSMFDADYITTMRTGAVAANTIDILGKKDYNILSFIGLGNVTKATMYFFAETHKDKQYTIKLFKYKDHAEKTIEEFKKYTNLKFVVCSDINKFMEDSDIIISGISYAEKDFCDANLYKKGCLIIPIHTLGFQNCDLTFDKIFGDDTDHVKGFKYFNQFKKFGELTDVVNEKIAGRENDEERILAYNIGLAIHDIYFAYKIYSKLKP